MPTTDNRLPLTDVRAINLIYDAQYHECFVDPYYDAVDWHEAARGDGRSYGGVEETVTRQPGEAFDAFYARAGARAHELNHTRYASYRR